MKPARSIDINLLPKDPFLSSVTGRVVIWSLSVGRYLLIFTLAIVIISFVSRFNLDRQITDLNAKIYQQLAVIQSYGTLEKDFKSAQNRIQVYADASDQKNLTEVFSSLSAITPPEVVIEKLSVSPINIQVSGSAPSQEVFNTLITNLQLSKDFSDISVTKVEANSASSDYSFQFSAATVASRDNKASSSQDANPSAVQPNQPTQPTDNLLN